MSQQREFMNETFHALAQPIVALRATIELALCKEMDEQASHRAFQDCLTLIDRLMQDLAVLRETAGLDEEPPLESCDGKALIESCVTEMTLVAQEAGVTLKLESEPAVMQCNTPMLQRAMFLLLDEMIAAAPHGGEISIALRKCEEGFALEIHPGTNPGQRQKLCHKLLQFSGGVEISIASECILVTFRDREYRRIPALTLVDKRILTSD